MNQTAIDPRMAARRCSGFSLLEVYMAVALLGTVASSAMLTLVPVGRQVRINRDMDSVVNQAKDVMERINVVPFSEVTVTYAPGTTIPLTGVDGGDLVVTYEDAAADPLQVRLTANWTSVDLGPIQRIFSTVRTE